jgi:hypothetical protein
MNAFRWTLPMLHTMHAPGMLLLAPLWRTQSLRWTTQQRTGCCALMECPSIHRPVP